MGALFCINADNFTQIESYKILRQFASHFTSIRIAFDSELLRIDCGRLAANQRLSATSSPDTAEGATNDLSIQEDACLWLWRYPGRGGRLEQGRQRAPASFDLRLHPSARRLGPGPRR